MQQQLVQKLEDYLLTVAVDKSKKYIVFVDPAAVTMRDLQQAAKTLKGDYPTIAFVRAFDPKNNIKMVEVPDEPIDS